ncbi:5883_t:CDS:1, partial [Scutellospora calospora]
CDPCHAYECNPSGETCEYGYRISCGQCGALHCFSDTTSATTLQPGPKNIKLY